MDDFLNQGIYIYISAGRWFKVFNFFDINFEILIDNLAYSFALLTTTIAVFVNMYIYSYFRYEPNKERLIILVNIFVISMVLLVISGNLIILFLGWELIGLSSFFLINF
jgi:NADH:ubiquinone oxidoreductase subunit 5 (subunit L)/multisubunit Na+/H+ antiporter MnhA subunit